MLPPYYVSLLHCTSETLVCMPQIKKFKINKVGHLLVKDLMFLKKDWVAKVLDSFKALVIDKRFSFSVINIGFKTSFHFFQFFFSVLCQRFEPLWISNFQFFFNFVI